VSGVRTPPARRALPLVAGIVILCGAWACGKKGPPQAPLRPVPSAAAGFSIERAGTAVTLRFTVPETNIDGSTPPAADRVDIFGLSKAADAPAPTAAELLVAANLVKSIAVRPPDETPAASNATPAAKPEAKPDTRPAPGEAASFVETVDTPDPATPMLRYYAAVSAAGRRRGPLSPVLRVPLSVSPASPTGLTIDYDERTLTAVWTAASAGQQFVVDLTDRAGAPIRRASPSPLGAPKVELPVALGQEVCLVVRAVEVRESVSLVGAPTAATCVTPVDRFAPPPPTGLIAAGGEGGVDLAWTASSAPDLAGYLVLRGDNPDGTLQPLMTAAVTGTTYRDQTAKAGVSYVYAVVAIDAAVPPNRSKESNRQSATAR